jgi:hypothetical protein
MNLFDAAEANRRRDMGMWLAANNKSELLASARGFAAFVAKNQGTVNADDVALMMAENGLDYSDLGNAAGSVFDGRFEWTGQVVPSRRPSTHGRLIRVWRWTGEAR